MKKLLVLTTAMLFVVGSLCAQETKKGEKEEEKNEEKMEKKSKMHKMDHQMKDCVMMKDGKVMVMKHGENSELTESMTLENGATVAPDGTVTTKEGKTKKLQDGQAVYMNGKMAKMHGMKSKT